MRDGTGKFAAWFEARRTANARSSVFAGKAMDVILADRLLLKTALPLSAAGAAT